MKLILCAALCFCIQFSFAQKLDINSLEKLLDAPLGAADTLLRKYKFNLSDKETDKRYINYYYTSYERKDLVNQLLRSLSLMDIYDGADTSRLIQYRTYDVKEEEDLQMQLIARGYTLFSKTANNFVYKNENYTITNKITIKTAKGGTKPVTAYEFELGR